MKDPRTPTDYIVTRKQKRYIAKENMKKEGIRNFNQHSYTSYTSKTGYTVTNRNPSFFAKNWKDYIKREDKDGSERN